MNPHWQFQLPIPKQVQFELVWHRTLLTGFRPLAAYSRPASCSPSPHSPSPKVPACFLEALEVPELSYLELVFCHVFFSFLSSIESPELCTSDHQLARSSPGHPVPGSQDPVAKLQHLAEASGTMTLPKPHLGS